MYNHNKAQQSKNRVHIFWDILYTGKTTSLYWDDPQINLLLFATILCTVIKQFDIKQNKNILMG